MIAHSQDYIHNDPKEDSSVNLRVFALKVFGREVKQECLDGVRNRFGVLSKHKAPNTPLLIQSYLEKEGPCITDATSIARK